MVRTVRPREISAVGPFTKPKRAWISRWLHPHFNFLLTPIFFSLSWTSRAQENRRHSMQRELDAERTQRLAIS